MISTVEKQELFHVVLLNTVSALFGALIVQLICPHLPGICGRKMQRIRIRNDD